ncbi:hypothetical protein CSC70_08795 [Pseudoxanthomonas kalamensis DSM 18571]|uniref:YfgM family protein n=1 Tax=Pseudoxanthomonas kalamensis TaxID=289483 RepID=UPI001391D965|nr:tetratricopeptide repeat protein [Pseudoxanthomonas kalamensis]KAF1709786.1 hypothetical protein CSC70_08795 [Pseudoxanthomonas kalamensis DSM 18571]
MAIDDLLDEHEQGERVRNWLKDNGTGLIAGIALGLAAILGWQWWQKDKLQGKQQAYTAYQDVDDLLQVEGDDTPDLDKARLEIAGLDGKDPIYRDLATLRLARAQVDAGKTDDAIATLRALKPEPALKALVDQRLARLLVETGKPDEALSVLGQSKDSASLEIRGDAELAAGKTDVARDLYLKALTGLDIASPQRRLLELKLTHVGGTPPKPAEPA